MKNEEGSVLVPVPGSSPGDRVQRLVSRNVVSTRTSSGGEVEDRHNVPDAVPGSWAHVIKRGRVENIIDHHADHYDHDTPKAHDDHDTAPFDVAAFLQYLDLNAPPIDIYDD